MTTRTITLILKRDDTLASRVILRHARRLAELGAHVLVKRAGRIVWDSAKGAPQ